MNFFRQMGNFSILILTIGIPGSGKTTWVESYKKNHPLTHVIATDDIRVELFGTRVCDPKETPLVHEEARRRVKALIDNPEEEDQKGIGPEIIVDSTNVESLEWLKYKELGPSLIFAKVFDVAPEQAWKQQADRKEAEIVPFEVLQMKWDQFQTNKKYLKHIFNMII